MSNTLHLDTETSGLPKKGVAVQEGQARICQIAMILSDPSGAPINEFSAIIKPDGWVIEPRAAEIHGINTEKAAAYGVPISMALYMFNRFLERADAVVAFNSGFDWRLLWIEHIYAQRIMPDKPWLCTMKESQPIVKIPATEAMLRAGRTGFKNPNLGEAYKGLFGKELDKAKQHGAMYDVRASKAIYYELRRREREAAQPAQGAAA